MFLEIIWKFENYIKNDFLQSICIYIYFTYKPFLNGDIFKKKKNFNLLILFWLRSDSVLLILKN